MSNAQCFKAIDDFASMLRGLPQVVKDSPAKLVPVVKTEVERAANAGQGLDGTKWAPRIKDGARALQNILKHVTVTVEGAIIWIRLRGGPVYAQFGTSREQKRPLLPSEGLPDKLGNAIRIGLVDMGAAFMKRAGGHRKATNTWDASAGGG